MRISFKWSLGSYLISSLVVFKYSNHNYNLSLDGYVPVETIRIVGMKYDFHLLAVRELKFPKW